MRSTRAASESAACRRAATMGYEDPLLTIAMLEDRVRTDSVVAAIRRVVREGDVVLDVGAGIGINTMAAVRAGARRVYAIEAASLRQTAHRLFDANGLLDRITYIQGDALEVCLPEKADVLICDLSSGHPLDSYPFSVITSVRDRLLKVEARLIPLRMRVYALPISVPEAFAARYTYVPAAVTRWSDWYGMSLHRLSASDAEPRPRYLNPVDVRDWPRLTAPIPIATCDFPDTADFPETAVQWARVRQSGELNGMMLYFDIDYSDLHVVSNHPDAGDRKVAWASPLYFSPGSTRVSAGDLVEVAYYFNRQKTPVVSFRSITKAKRTGAR